jgi:hypothetical protein
MSFFDFLNSINDTKKDLLKEDPQSEKDYVPFMVNRGLSYFTDTILYANEMNMHAGLPKKWQYDFYLHGLKKKRRFSKWHKKEPSGEDLKLIIKEFGYSAKRAQEVLTILNEDQIKELRAKHDVGGK